MFRSLGIFNYRVWFIGALVSNVGAWMQSTAQNWVVLTELTPGDAGAVGVTMALQFGPPLLLVGLTGWATDRFERRHILLATQGVSLLLATAIGILILTGAMTLPLMYAFALGLGLVAAFDNPARQASFWRVGLRARRQSRRPGDTEAHTDRRDERRRDVLRVRAYG